MYKTFLWLARAGAILALIVVTVGAYVRLSDAGLGCPDWPGCYGHVVLTQQLAHDPALGAEYGRAVHVGKAWREMFHRYLASSLGLICLALAVLAFFNRRDPRQSWRVPLVLVGLIIFQGLLGMWTVTLLLKPLIVVGHLLGGFATLALLFWLARGRPATLVMSRALRAFSVVATLVLVAQIALGGWTSSNYAATACPDFPTCQTQWWPRIMDFHDAFTPSLGVGTDYQGGILPFGARVAIQVTHRLGAVVTALFLLALAVALMRLRGGRTLGGLIAAALILQLAIGSSMVLLHFPLPVAVAHNTGAALLLLAVVNAHKRIWQS